MQARRSVIDLTTRNTFVQNLSPFQPEQILQANQKNWFIMKVTQNKSVANRFNHLVQT